MDHHNIKWNSPIIWLARILGLLILLFTGYFTLNSFSPGIPLKEQYTPFLIHLIPALVMLAMFVYAWRRALAGGLLLILLGLAFGAFFFIRDFQSETTIWGSLLHILFLSVPILLTGILFVAGDYLARKENEKSQ